MNAAEHPPVLLWFRRYLRTADDPALHAASGTGAPVIPVFLRDEGVTEISAAARMRAGMAADELDQGLRRLGSRLILRSGPAAEALAALVAETGARAVWWTRLHDPLSRRRDEAVRRALSSLAVEVREFGGHLLQDPAALLSGSGRPYQVYAPFLRALRRTDPGAPLPAPTALRPPVAWPESERMRDWRLDAGMNRGARVVARWQKPGEFRARGAAPKLRGGASERLWLVAGLPGA